MPKVIESTIYLEDADKYNYEVVVFQMTNDEDGIGIKVFELPVNETTGYLLTIKDVKDVKNVMDIKNK